MTSVGSIERIEEFPSALIAARNIDIWLPPNYSDQINYPVLYMHDGQMLYDESISWNKQAWNADDMANRLIQARLVDPFIIVGIWNAGGDRFLDYFPEKPFHTLPASLQDSFIRVEQNDNQDRHAGYGPRADAYLSFITKELKPYIDSVYSTASGKENTFIAGSSNGGLISWYALCEYPEVFGGAACISTNWPGVATRKDDLIPKAFANYLSDHLPDPAEHRIYFDLGTRTLDSLYPPLQKMMDSVLLKRGFNTNNFQSRLFAGENHSETSWSKRLYIPLIFLLSKKDQGRLILASQNPDDFSETGCAYLNTFGDTIIPTGKYAFCFTDTITDVGFVIDKNQKIIAINALGEEMYEVFNFENGPDPLSEGKFRMIKDGLIGYTNALGDIHILPQYKCAFPFENGIAQVSYDCEKIKSGENSIYESEHWIEIDQDGNLIDSLE